MELEKDVGKVRGATHHIHKIELYVQNILQDWFVLQSSKSHG